MTEKAVELAVRGSRKYAFSEIDASRFFHYRVGEQVEIPLPSVELEDRYSESYFSAGLTRLGDVSIDWSGFTHPQLYSFFVKFNIVFNSPTAFTSRVIVRPSGKVFTDMYKPISVVKGKNTFSGLLPLVSEGVFPSSLSVFIEGERSIELVSASNFLVRQSNLRDIPASLFSTDAVYVTCVYLNPGDSVGVDSPFNLISNSVRVFRELDFSSKPLVTDRLFLTGSPEVSFFVMEEEDL